MRKYGCNVCGRIIDESKPNAKPGMGGHAWWCEQATEHLADQGRCEQGPMDQAIWDQMAWTCKVCGQSFGVGDDGCLPEHDVITEHGKGNETKYYKRRHCYGSGKHV